ncbi:MAG: carboxypeptidase-like regulatory domain-containing protein [Bacteroidales bacterium]|jgi:hypothetical protein|nr:carboxypeptidase-like regulatory domain-containing protein [Bacteroidales bacterium]
MLREILHPSFLYIKKSFLVLSLLLFAIVNSLAQQSQIALVYGKISDENGFAVPLTNISILNGNKGIVSDENGNYQLEILADKLYTLQFSFIGYQTEEVKIQLKAGQKRNLNITLFQTTKQLSDVVVEDKETRKTTLTRIDPQSAQVIPGVSGSIESLIKTLPGVTSNNELSSQYSVRGGSFDENLIYVNGIEVYRPLLTRSGQQEGLSFINSDLVSSILFSAGGFDAKYGDKMASVLDIKYRRPTQFKGSVKLSLLEASLHLEDALINDKLTYLIGFRQKSNQYLLNTLDTKGEYQPSFSDIQALIGFQPNDKWNISFLGNYSRNSYKLIPQNRETAFGHVKEAYQLKIYFDGQEVDRYNTLFGALTSTYLPNKNLSLKLIASAFQSLEEENYDIQGQYWIGQLETNLGEEEFGQVIETQGIGTYLNHARNKLNAKVWNLEHQGIFEHNAGLLQWGIKLQHESIEDQLNQWIMIDSAGFSKPYPRDSLGYVDPLAQTFFPFILNDTLFADNSLNSNRINAFAQNSWEFNSGEHQLFLTAGGRLNYWDYNKQLLFSPRASIAIKPDWQKDILLRFSSGIYFQSPFYRELRRPNGSLNSEIQAQSSLHFVLGSDYNFNAWGRPFKMVTELYYKHFDHLIPFIVDNVRLIYSGENSSRGYATGIDMKINGEFVEGLESWLSVSVMQTNEILRDNFYSSYFNNTEIPVENIWTPRPTDQRVAVSLFFQDYMPMLPTFKMNMNLSFGTGLPVYYPGRDFQTVITRTPPYRRVDIGFAYEIIGPNSKRINNKIAKQFTNVDITLEVLNLLDIKNVVSYLWVKDNSNYVYLVPNYLTPRRINLKLAFKF